MKYALLILLVSLSNTTIAQIPETVYSDRIKTVLLHPYGNQLGYPIIRLNSAEQLELHFDDLDGNVKNYGYTFQLCNADWTPSMLSHFDFIKGFSQVRLSTYRISSIAFTRYTHYQAMIPDRNCVPSRSGNYILKVFLNGDTSKLIFTKRMMVVQEKSTILAEIQQPFNGQLFRTHQKVQFRVNLNEQLDVVNAIQQIKVAIMQNNRWDNAVTEIRPTFFSRKTVEYNTENDCVFPAGKEWRWVDLRSFRFQSERIANALYSKTATEIFVKPEMDRKEQRFNFYRDANGMFNIEASENINPFWQADYATVNFKYVPPGNTAIAGKDVYVFGQLSNYNLSDGAKMTFNPATGVYESSLFLKQGYYDYCYATVDRNSKKRIASFDITEGNLWETENNYTIFVYYRPLAGRADELIGFTSVNSLVGRRGFVK
ncbi:MAG: type IX secretion system plug protein [Flavitalea sp.]